MPETKERDPKHSFEDWIEFLKETTGDIFGIPSWMFTDEPLQTEIGVTLSETPTRIFTREQRQMLNQIKEQAEDVEFEEIQG